MGLWSLIKLICHAPITKIYFAMNAPKKPCGVVWLQNITGYAVNREFVITYQTNKKKFIKSHFIF